MSSDRWTDIRPVSPATDPFRAYPEGAGTWSRRVMVVEDEPLLAALLSEFLTGAGFEVRTCASAADVADCVEDFDPDAALIDINPGRGPSGVQVGQLLHRTSPHIGLVFLTKYADPRMTTGQGVPAGSAFLHKGAITDASVLIEAVETVLRDGLPLGPRAPPRARRHDHPKRQAHPARRETARGRAWCPAARPHQQPDWYVTLTFTRLAESPEPATPSPRTEYAPFSPRSRRYAATLRARRVDSESSLLVVAVSCTNPTTTVRTPCFLALRTIASSVASPCGEIAVDSGSKNTFPFSDLVVTTRPRFTTIPSDRLRTTPDGENPFAWSVWSPASTPTGTGSDPE